MAASWEEATTAQYDDDTNLAARQELFTYLTEASPLPRPLSQMSDLEDQLVLDVGCGNGVFLGSALAGGANALGTDLSMGMVAKAHADTAAPTFQSDAARLPIASNSVDTVLALWMMYHVPDKASAAAEFRRILKPGGMLVSSTNSEATSDIDQLMCAALADVLGAQVSHWHPALSFTAENGAAILGESFPNVITHPFGNVFEVTDAQMLVRYAGSMTGPVQEQHGQLDVPQFLTAVGRRAEKELSTTGKVTIQRRGAVFIAQA